MGRKLTTSQKEEREIIKNNLNNFGLNITTLVKGKYIRENTGRLKKTMNYTVKPFNVLTFSQQIYGKFNTYKDKPTKSTDEKDYNPLLQEIIKAKSNLTNIIIKELKESILFPFKNGGNTNNN